MNSSITLLSRQGHRLLQIGIALFLYSSFDGFAISLLRLTAHWIVRAYA